jgi:hypothetical protein
MDDAPKHRRDVEPDEPSDSELADRGPAAAHAREYALVGGVAVPQGATFDAALADFIDGDPEHPSRRNS